MKRNIKRILGLSLAFSLFVLAVCASDSIAIKSKAAGSTGAWVVESHDVKYSGYVDYYKDGTEDKKYIMNNKYDEKDSKVYHYLTGYDYANYTWYKADFIGTCVIPPATITGDSKVTLPLTLSIENNEMTVSAKGELQYRAQLTWNSSHVDGYRYFISDTKDDETMIDVFTVYPNRQTAEDSFSCTIPSGKQDGEKAELIFCTNNYDYGVIKTIWTYTWKSGASGDTAQIDKSIKAPAKISGIKAKKKGNGCTIFWKKTSKNCKGYEIQVATDKKFKNNVKSVMVSGKNKKSGKVTGLNKNTTYYSRVRAYNKSAKGYRYGKWSKITKFKTGK
ncbi:fibronectin type III domain-containing protein [Butyrivibrio sp. WCD3002]|uniref:fibronectin type III domain-containing protein n=1 Tax=Butyrivibrio sp. WCD3002 TaxID=1280676 RepID=UPI0004258122|nr:fibronectin type III domain-containing protein [Butyrivibrio sp. WCD3002]